MKKLFARRMITLCTGILLLTLLAACGSANGNGTGNGGGNTSSGGKNGKGCTKVGVLLPETASSARWDSEDKPLLTTDIKNALGSSATVDYNNAGGNQDTQQSQAEADLTKGDCILVVAANDGVKAAAIVSSAKQQSVPVIAYDRLIQSSDLNFYVSFDNVQVGKLQGQYIAANYKSYISSGHNNVVMINGAQTDNNAILFRQGALSVLQPLYDSKTLTKVYDQYTPQWDNATAQTEMEGALTSNKNNVQIAYVANDGMANNVIAALKAQHLNGKVIVTGQDATVAGIQNILLGNQSMTVYKAIGKEAQATADLVKAISQGTDTTSLINGQTKTQGGASIPSTLETPVAVDKTNIASTVLADGFVNKAQICQNFPSVTDNIF